MSRAGSVSEKGKHAIIDPEHPTLGIERICRECSEEAEPPDVFLLSGRTAGNSLLAVSTFFLEDSQLLGCPGLPLVGAVFDPDWGFARGEIGVRPDASAEFRVPHGNADTFTVGDTSGYRLCPIDHHEIPDAIRQLAQIRAALAKTGHRPSEETGIRVTLTEL